MSQRFDAFISHNGLDKPIVERLCLALLQAGVRPWFDKWDLAFGDPWIRETERVLAQMSKVLVCVGAHGFSEWHDCERQAAMLRSADGEVGGVVPVLLPGASVTQLPVFLRMWKPLDLRAEADWQDGIHKLVEEITGKQWVAGEFAGEPNVRPYRGLHPFTEADAGWMFGREREEARLIEDLRAGQRFIALIGASGSGKSSLVRAGVVPIVRTRGVDGVAWQTVVMRPGGRPCSELAVRLVELERRLAGRDVDAERDGRDLAALRDQLTTRDEALADRVDQLVDEPLLLVVDQLEEVFMATDKARAPEADAFLRNLMFATEHKSRLRVIVTVRADFTDACLCVPGFAERMARMNFALPPLAQDELVSAIRRPALRVGHDVEQSLIAALITATNAQPGRLPLLQHTLDRLWDERDRGRRLLSFETYERRIISLELSIAVRADAVLTRLHARSSEHEAAVARVFLRMVHLGVGTGDTRRRVPRSELRGDAVAAQVIEAFLAEGLLVTDKDGDDAKTEVIELAHEALITHWDKLQGWIGVQRGNLQLRQDVNHAAKRWISEGRPPSELWRGGRLAHVRGLVEEKKLDFTVEELDFLTASSAAEHALRAAEEAARREAARRKKQWDVLVRSAVVGLTLMLAFALVQFFDARANARESAALAERNAGLARASAEAAQRAEQATQDQKAERAQLMARVPGQELAALALAVQAVGAAGGEPSITALRGLAEGLAHARRVMYLRGHTGGVIAAWRPDAKLVATAGADSEARLWDTDTGTLRHTLVGHTKAIQALAWTNDGTRLATASDDGSGRIWDGESGTAVAVLAGHTRMVDKLEWSPDGARLVTLSGDMTARMWDGRTGQALAVLEHTGPLSAAAWSRGGFRLATTCSGGTTKLWDGRTGAPVATLAANATSAHSLAWQPGDSMRLATAGIDRMTRLWNGSAGTLWRDLPADGDLPIALAWAPDGKRLAVSFWDQVELWDPQQSDDAARVIAAGNHPVWTRDGQILATIAAEDGKIWDTTTGELRFVLSGHTEAIGWPAWSNDGRHLLTHSDDHSARVWDRETGKQSATLIGHGAPLTSATWSPDGAPRLATAAADGTAAIWALRVGAIEQIHTGHVGPLTAAIWAPDGDVVTAGKDGFVTRRDASTAKVERQLGHDKPVLALAWAPDGVRLASAGVDNKTRIWSADEAAPVVLDGHEQEVNAVAWAPDGTRLATASADGTVKLWSGAGQLQATLAAAVSCPDCLRERDPRVDASLLVAMSHARGHVSGLAWSPDSTRVATSSIYGVVQLWDAASGALQTTHKAHDKVWAIAWAPDGNRLASAGEDATVAIWDVRTGAQAAALTGHTQPIHALAWTLDGSRLASAGVDGVARVWDVTTGTLVATLAGHTQPITALAWAPEDGLLATVSEDSTLRLWTGSDSAPLATFAGHTATIRSVAWSRDGASVLTGSDDGTAIIWIGDPGRWLARACEVLAGSTAAREFTPETRAVCDARINIKH